MIYMLIVHVHAPVELLHLSEYTYHISILVCIDWVASNSRSYSLPVQSVFFFRHRRLATCATAIATSVACGALLCTVQCTPAAVVPVAA
jgi:hypothetical protein